MTATAAVILVATASGAPDAPVVPQAEAHQQSPQLQVLRVTRDRSIRPRRVTSLTVFCPRGTFPTGWGFRAITLLQARLAPVQLLAVGPFGRGRTVGWTLRLANPNPGVTVVVRGTAICFRGRRGLTTRVAPGNRLFAGAAGQAEHANGPLLEAGGVVSTRRIRPGRTGTARATCPRGQAPGDFTFTSGNSRLLGVTHRRRGARYGLDGRFFTPAGTGKTDTVRFGLVCIRARGLGLDIVGRRGAAATRRADARESARPGLRFIIRTQRVRPDVQGLLVVYPSRSALAPVTFPALGPAPAPRNQNDDAIPPPTDGERAWAARDRVGLADPGRDILLLFLAEVAFDVRLDGGLVFEPRAFTPRDTPTPIVTRSVQGTGGATVKDGVKAERTEGIRNPFAPLPEVRVNCTATWERPADPSLPLLDQPNELLGKYTCDEPIAGVRVVPGQPIFKGLNVPPTGFAPEACTVKPNELACFPGGVLGNGESQFFITTTSLPPSGMGGQLHVVPGAARGGLQGPFPITGP